MSATSGLDFADATLVPISSTSGRQEGRAINKVKLATEDELKAVGPTTGLGVPGEEPGRPWGVTLAEPSLLRLRVPRGGRAAAELASCCSTPSTTSGEAKTASPQVRESWPLLSKLPSQRAGHEGRKGPSTGEQPSKEEVDADKVKLATEDELKMGPTIGPGVGQEPWIGARPAMGAASSAMGAASFAFGYRGEALESQPLLGKL